jgi:hypothetical protein
MNTTKQIFSEIHSVANSHKSNKPQLFDTLAAMLSAKFQLKVGIFLLLLLLIECASATPRNTPKHSFSSILQVKEFTPASPKLLPPVVIYEPVLLKETALFRVENKKEKGLIVFLNDAGYTVYLVSSSEMHPDFKTHSLEFDKILNQVADKHRNREVILAGASLGGQAVLEYMTLPTNLNHYARIKKIFFIGTGIDYNYSGSFAEKSEKFGYEQKLVKDLCPAGTKTNFCIKYIRFNNSLQKIDNSKKEIHFNRIPKIEKDYLSRFHQTKLQLPYFFIYGKLDSISPEESIYPLFHKLRSNAKMDSSNRLYEASEANGQSIDYDHADLFLYPDVEKEVYSKLLHWLEK